MTKVRCQDCGKVQECKKSEIDDTSCDCGGDFAIQGSEDDTYEPTKCPICGDEVDTNDEEACFNCDECNNENLCADCCIQFDNVGLVCLDCIKAKAREQKVKLGEVETKIEYQEKIIEKPVKVFINQDGVPIDTSFNPSNKSKFD